MHRVRLFGVYAMDSLFCFVELCFSSDFSSGLKELKGVQLWISSCVLFIHLYRFFFHKICRFDVSIKSQHFINSFDRNCAVWVRNTNALNWQYYWICKVIRIRIEIENQIHCVSSVNWVDGITSGFRYHLCKITGHLLCNVENALRKGDFTDCASNVKCIRNWYIAQ